MYNFDDVNAVGVVFGSGGALATLSNGEIVEGPPLGESLKPSIRKLTTDLTERFHTIVIEEYNPRKGFITFRKQLVHKAGMRGGMVLDADHTSANDSYIGGKWKRCFSCNYKFDELPQSEDEWPCSIRKWNCPSCGIENIRDVNAARRLREYALLCQASLDDYWQEKNIGAQKK